MIWSFLIPATTCTNLAVQTERSSSATLRENGKLHWQMNLKTLWPDTKCKTQNDHQSVIWSSHAPQKSPVIDTERTHSSNFFMSVSSSQGLTSSRTDDLPPAQPKAICQYPAHSFETAEVSLQTPRTSSQTVSLKEVYSLIAKTPQTSAQNCPEGGTVLLQRLHRHPHKTVSRRRYTISLQSLRRLPHKLCPEGSTVNMKKKKDSFFFAFWQTLPSINPKGNVSSECTSLKHKELTT
jgi:hypothetical protein